MFLAGSDLRHQGGSGSGVHRRRRGDQRTRPSGAARAVVVPAVVAPAVVAAPIAAHAFGDVDFAASSLRDAADRRVAGRAASAPRTARYHPRARPERGGRASPGGVLALEPMDQRGTYARLYSPRVARACQLLRPAAVGARPTWGKSLLPLTGRSRGRRRRRISRCLRPCGAHPAHSLGCGPGRRAPARPSPVPWGLSS